MNFDKTLNFLFSEVTNSFWIKLEQSMNQIGLHSGQVFVLISLWESDGQTQVEIAGKLNLSAPTINKMIKSLGKNDFVKTRRSKSDARKVRVFLTDKGNGVKTLVKEQWEKLEIEFFSNLSETEKLILRQICEKLKEQIAGNLAGTKTSK